MKNPDERLSFRPYRQVLESVQTQFDLLRFSLGSLKPNDRKRFFKGIAETKLAQIEKFRLKAKELKFMPDEEVDQTAQHQIERILIRYSEGWPCRKPPCPFRVHGRQVKPK